MSEEQNCDVSEAPTEPDERRPVAETLDRAARPTLGLVSVGQLRAAGMTRSRQRTLVARGALIPVHDGVYRTAGTRLTTRRRLLAGCLAVGGLVGASHRGALWVWRLFDDMPPVEVAVPGNRHPRVPGCVVHRSLDLTEQDLTVRRGVPVTRPARTLLDVGCLVPRAVLVEAVERALVFRLVTVPGLRLALDQAAARGRNGVGPLREVLDHRALGDVAPESLLEPLAARLLADGNVEGVRYQETLMVEGRTFRPDFYIPDAKLVIEVDGLDTHGTREAFDRDLERQNHLIANGYHVLRYTVTHLRDPDRTAAEIERTAARRRMELAERRSA